MTSQNPPEPLPGAAPEPPATTGGREAPVRSASYLPSATALGAGVVLGLIFGSVLNLFTGNPMAVWWGMGITLAIAIAYDLGLWHGRSQEAAEDGAGD